MLQFDPGRRSERRFILYMEGARDRGILRGWSYRLLPAMAQRLFGASVILGGRQPRRALEHFRGAGGAGGKLRALCILDRDDGESPAPGAPSEPGLEFFTWSRRHIESYLLVPAAIRRVLRLPDGDRRIERLLCDQLPSSDDEEAWRRVDAKHLLGPRSRLARGLGRPLPLTRVARATREGELHPDVHALFDRIRRCLADSG